MHHGVLMQEAEHRAAMLEAVAAAEPDMLRLEHTVTLVDSSFTTQSGISDPHEFALAHALGLGADLPRMLRQAGQVRCAQHQPLAHRRCLCCTCVLLL